MDINKFVKKYIKHLSKWQKSPEYLIRREQEMIKEHEENIRCLKLKKGDYEKKDKT